MTKTTLFLVDEPAGAKGSSASLEEVLARITKIANMSPTDLSTRMSTKEGSEIAHFETERIEPSTLLHAWDAVGHASPAELTEEQYDTFLRGQHPVLETPLYGGHLKS